MPNHRRQDRELDALYATLPKLECQGFCHDSCGPIETSVREGARIVERARKPISCGAGASCSMLDEDRRCSVYEIRPMVCRLWGLVRSMRCPYGCVPEGGLLSDGEGVRLLVAADVIGGRQDGDRLARIAEKMLASLSDEQVAALAGPIIGKGRATVSGRLPTLHRTGVRSVVETPGIPVGETAVAYPQAAKPAFVCGECSCEITEAEQANEDCVEHDDGLRYHWACLQELYERERLADDE